MAIDHQAEIEALRKTLQQISSVSNPEGLRERITELTEASATLDLQDDQDRAQSIISKLPHVQAGLDKTNVMSAVSDDLEALKEMIDEEAGSNSETAAEFYSDLKHELGQIGADMSEFEIHALLSGEYDEREAVVTIRPGAGGVNVTDFARILQYMYLHWVERRGYSAKVLDTSYVEEARIRSTTFEVSAPYAYETLSVETGTYRLMRISPFDNQERRQTSFAAVEVIPFVGQTDHIDVPEADIRVNALRLSGSDGQFVNTTDFAVRVTYVPTGIIISMQDEKSQTQNRTAVMRVLQSHPLPLKQEGEAHEKRELAGDIKASRGDQMYSYVLQSYQMVKGLRTGYEMGNPEVVFDGDIDGFIDAGIRWRATGIKASEEE